MSHTQYLKMLDKEIQKINKKIDAKILQGKEYFGKPADMWALGVLIYTLVEGKFPFEGKQTHDILE